MKKKVIKLIFDIMMSLAAFVFAWLLLAWGLENLFYGEAFYLVSLQIISSLVELIGGCIMIGFVFMDINNVKKERSKRNEQEK